jgi:membrane-associated phospholipid phosphatase
VVGLWISTVFLRYHYGIDLVAGIALALGCIWLTRWYAQSQLCDEVEAECAAHGKQAVVAHESLDSQESV